MASLSAPQRGAIWSALDKLSRHHRAFRDATWVLPEADIATIEELASRFLPEDPVGKYRFLFDEQMPDIGSKGTDDFAGYQTDLAKLRNEAIREIVAAEGYAGVERLLKATKESFQLGWSVADSGVDVAESEALSGLDSHAERKASYALGYARRRSNSDGLPWVDAILPTLAVRPLAQARLLRVTPDYPDVWERVAKLGGDVESHYWQEFLPYGLGTDFPYLREVAVNLLKHGRPGTATDMLSMYADRSHSSASPELIADVLEALVEAPPDEQRRVSPYELQQLLEILRGTTLHEDRLAVIEWRVLPGLGYGTPAPVLERRLARDPDFFVRILSLCFRRADGTSEQEPNPGAAQNAFHLLHDWHVVPGSTVRGGDVDDAKLREWLDGAFKLLAEADRVGVGASYIGHVFAHAKEDSDGSWPTKSVRDAIERLAKDEVERGLGIQIYNNRGVTSRGLTDGGTQERGLAERLERWESLIRDSWPRTAAVLRSVAQGYRAQAQAEDEEAERFKKRLDPF